MTDTTSPKKVGRRSKERALHPDVRALLRAADSKGGLTVRELFDGITAAGRHTGLEMIRRTLRKMPDSYVSHFEPINYTWTPVWKVAWKPESATKPTIKITRALQDSYR